MAGTLKEEAIVLALKAMSLLNADDAPKIEPLADQDQCQTYKVCAGGRPLLVRASNKGNCAAHFYATTAARHVPDFRPKVLGYNAERGILVEEWLALANTNPWRKNCCRNRRAMGGRHPSVRASSAKSTSNRSFTAWGKKSGKFTPGQRASCNAGSDGKALATQAEPPETYLRAARCSSATWRTAYEASPSKVRALSQSCCMGVCRRARFCSVKSMLPSSVQSISRQETQRSISRT